MQPALAHGLDVKVVVLQGVWDEKQGADAAEEGAHLFAEEADAFGGAEAARAEQDTHGNPPVMDDTIAIRIQGAGRRGCRWSVSHYTRRPRIKPRPTCCPS